MRIILGFKEQHDFELGKLMADLMLNYLSPPVMRKIDCVSYIPDTYNACTTRGFDHSYVLGCFVAERINKPLLHALKRPSSFDQRTLSKRERFSNIYYNSALNATAQTYLRSLHKTCEQQGVCNPEFHILLIDDVFTTGSSLGIAAFKLKKCSNIIKVHGLSFARTL